LWVDASSSSLLQLFWEATLLFEPPKPNIILESIRNHKLKEDLLVNY